MKVYIITCESFPNGMAATSRIKCYASGLINSGIACKVIIAKRTEVYGKPPKNIVGQGTEDGIDFEYIGGSPLRASNIVVRKLSDYIDFIRTYRKILKEVNEGDVVLTYMREHPFCKYIIRAAHKVHAKVVRDLCEYPFGTGDETERIKKKRERYLMDVFPKYDGYIAISQSLYELANKYKSGSGKIVKIPIMIRNGQSSKNSHEGDIPRTFIPAGIPYIFHSGTLYEQKDGILGAVEAFAIAKKKIKEPLKYVLTGNIESSPVREELKSIIQKYSVRDDVVFVGYLTMKELESLQQNCMMMIINKNDNQQNRYCFATKLGEYLLTGKPVVTTTVGEVKFYLKDGENAYLISPGDTEALAERVEYIFTHSQESQSVGANGKKIAQENFSSDVQGIRLRDFLKSLYL